MIKILGGGIVVEKDAGCACVCICYPGNSSYENGYSSGSAVGYWKNHQE